MNKTRAKQILNNVYELCKYVSIPFDKRLYRIAKKHFVRYKTIFDIKTLLRYNVR